MDCSQSSISGIDELKSLENYLVALARKTGGIKTQSRVGQKTPNSCSFLGSLQLNGWKAALVGDVYS